ncbi:MAG: preprotein translocase subunit YajC [Bacteroidota bacterium]
MLYIALQADGGSFLGQLPLIAILLAIFYFFFIRPSAKKQKDQDKFIASLEKGKEVVTKSGVIGKISKISDREVTLQVSEKNFIRMTRGSISNELTAAYFDKSEKK